MKPRSENGSSKVKFEQLPIITHTCPTPVHSPSVSSKNSPMFMKHRFLFDPIRIDERTSTHNTRKYSLDSSPNARYIGLNKLITRSTNSKIYDRSAMAPVSLASGEIKRPHSFDLSLRPRLVPQILISDAQTTNDVEMIDEDNAWKRRRFNAKGTSQSFNVPETRSGAKSLAIPNALPPSRVRSKSEKVKVRRPNKLSLNSEPVNEDDINTNDNNLLTDRLIVGNGEKKEEEVVATNLNHKKGNSLKKLRINSKESLDNKSGSAQTQDSKKNATKKTKKSSKKDKKKEENKSDGAKDDDEMIVSCFFWF